MAECFCCREPVKDEYRLLFRTPIVGEAKSVVFCGRCSKRVGGYIRFLRRVMSTGTVVEG